MMNLDKMKTQDLMDLIEKAKAQIQKQEVFQFQMEEIKRMIAEYGLDVTDVIRELGGTMATTKAEVKKYQITLGETTFETSHKKLTKAITDSPEYQQVVKERKELNVLDTFMRAYSTEYQQDFPINAKYNGEEFYMNEKGTLNGVSQNYYKKYLKDNALEDSKKHIQDFKKLVIAK